MSLVERVGAGRDVAMTDDSKQRNLGWGLEKKEVYISAIGLRQDANIRVSVVVFFFCQDLV